jgi:hypothetical protein
LRIQRRLQHLATSRRNALQRQSPPLSPDSDDSNAASPIVAKCMVSAGCCLSFALQWLATLSPVVVTKAGAVCRQCRSSICSRTTSWWRRSQRETARRSRRQYVSMPAMMFLHPLDGNHSSVLPAASCCGRALRCPCVYRRQTPCVSTCTATSAAAGHLSNAIMQII